MKKAKTLLPAKRLYKKTSPTKRPPARPRPKPKPAEEEPVFATEVRGDLSIPSLMEIRLDPPSSLEVTDTAAAAVATSPRVALADIEAAIVSRIGTTADKALAHTGNPIPASYRILSLCFVTFANGFSIVGKSAPASEANFDEALGAKFAYEDAIRAAWPLFGYALRDRIMRGIPE